VKVSCLKDDPKPSIQNPPSDVSSDAKFFVFTGVVSFLATMALLVIYVFFAPIYESEDKKPPLYV